MQAVLAARIDLLPAVERSALLSASVVGRVFWNGAVARLLEDGNGAADEALGRLEDRELAGPRSSGRESPASASSSSSTFSRATLRTARSPGGTVLGRMRMSPPGSSPPRGSASASSPICSDITSGSRTRDPSPTRPLLWTAARRSGCDSSKQLWLPPPRRRAGCCSTKANAFGEAALDVAADAHERSLALEALGLSALRDYRGDDSWRYLSQAVDERIAGARGSEEGIAMLGARAVESPTRWPASMFSPPGPEEVGPYVEIGLEHAAAEGEARVRLLLARSMWIFAFRREGFDEAEADAARRAGEEAFALAEALGRDDLASAALDGVQSIEFIVGLHGLTWAVVERRLAIVERLTDRWEVGDALQTAADTALAEGRYEDARRWASEGFERARGGPDVWREQAWRGERSHVSSSATGTERSRTTSAWRRRAPRRASGRPDTSR